MKPMQRALFEQLCLALGLTKCKTWELPECNERANTINQLKDESKRLKDPKLVKMFEKMCDTIEKGVQIEVVGDSHAAEPAPEANGTGATHTAPKGGKAAKASAKASKAPGGGGGGTATATATKPAKEAVDKDALGSKKGTGAAAINAVMLQSKKPLSVAEVAEKCGLDKGRVASHLAGMFKNGTATKDQDKKYMKKV